jgi:hypothetical protein
MAAILYKWFLISGLWFLVGSPQTEAFSHLQNSKKESSTALAHNKFHPFYVSVAEINHNAKEKILEISCKLFAEDMEETLKKNYKTEVDFSLAKDKEALDKFIPDYMNKHFALAVDGRPVRLSYIGYEQDKESVFCYFQVDNVPSIKKVDINNSILYDFNEGQINIMHVVVNGKRHSTKLNYPDKQVSVSFAP